MKTFLSIIFILFAGNSFSQTPGFTKLEIGTTGCTAYFPGEMNFELSYSDDSSEVFTGEISAGTMDFAIICVKFKVAIGDDQAANEELLIAYLDYLKQALGIVSSAGYGKGHTMEDHPSATGIIDYWEDAAQQEFRVKAWVDDRFLAVLYLKGDNNSSICDVYLNSFRFPAE